MDRLPLTRATTLIFIRKIPTVYQSAKILLGHSKKGDPKNG